MGKIVHPFSNIVNTKTPIPLIQWRHLYADMFRHNQHLKTRIEFLNDPTKIPPSSNEKWSNIGVLFGGGKESLLTLCMLSESTKNPIHAITIGTPDENTEIIKRLEIFKKMGMNLKIHSVSTSIETTMLK